MSDAAFTIASLPPPPKSPPTSNTDPASLASGAGDDFGTVMAANLNDQIAAHDSRHAQSSTSRTDKHAPTRKTASTAHTADKTSSAAQNDKSSTKSDEASASNKDDTKAENSAKNDKSHAHDDQDESADASTSASNTAAPAPDVDNKAKILPTGVKPAPDAAAIDGKTADGQPSANADAEAKTAAALDGAAIKTSEAGTVKTALVAAPGSDVQSATANQSDGTSSTDGKTAQAVDSAALAAGLTEGSNTGAGAKLGEATAKSADATGSQGQQTDGDAAGKTGGPAALSAAAEALSAGLKTEATGDAALTNTGKSDNVSEIAQAAAQLKDAKGSNPAPKPGDAQQLTNAINQAAQQTAAKTDANPGPTGPKGNQHSGATSQPTTLNQTPDFAALSAQASLTPQDPSSSAAPQAAQGTAHLTASSQAALPDTSTIRAQMNGPRLVIPAEQMAYEIRRHQAAGMDSFKIRLDPPELGRIDVRLDVSSDGQTKAHLTADHQDTLNLMQRDAHSLERALNNLGLKTTRDGLNFSLRQDGAFNHGQGGDQSGGGSGPSHYTGPEETASEVWTPVRANIIDPSRVDITI